MKKKNDLSGMDIEIENYSIRRIQCCELQNCFSFWDFENNSEKRKRIEHEIDNNIRTMYAYILNGKYVAGVSLCPADNKTVYLSYLVVNEEYRNQGIGTKMINYALKTSKNDGYSYIILKVDNDNTEAEKLYKKLGFAAIEKSCEITKMRIDL